MRFTTLIQLLLVFLAPAWAKNSTYHNPILPGWHSDPSCTPVNGTFFCVTSTFISFPGLPIYASRDLVNYKLISHVWNRETQLPGYSYATDAQQQGMYNLWNGTDGVWSEGPHIYKKDGWYYLLIAEGGTADDHAVTMARAKRITGQYIPSPHNPHLTNRGTDQYFQTVGHADLFQDGNGSCPSEESCPVGNSPPHPSTSPGTGPFNSDPDIYDFPAGSQVPRNLVYWRVPRQGMIGVTERGFQVVPRRNNLGNKFNNTMPASKAISFVGRRQTDSTFKFSVDMSFDPIEDGQEAGVTAFLTKYANVQLGVTRVNGSTVFRFNSTESQNKYIPLPNTWKGQFIRLMIEMCTPDEYLFSAALAAGGSETLELGKAATSQVSGGTGSFVGKLIGVYATFNRAGDNGLDCPVNTPNACYNKWRYTGVKQWVDKGIAVASGEFNQKIGSGEDE